MTPLLGAAAQPATVVSISVNGRVAVGPVTLATSDSPYRLRVRVSAGDEVTLTTVDQQCSCDATTFCFARFVQLCPGGAGHTCAAADECSFTDRNGPTTCELTPPNKTGTCRYCQDIQGWQTVFRQAMPALGGGFFNRNDYEKNPQNPQAKLYSILNRLETMRGADGKFHFRLSWPSLCTRAPDFCVGGVEYNEWKQTSNPTTQPIAGYEPIDVTYRYTPSPGPGPAARCVRGHCCDLHMQHACMQHNGCFCRPPRPHARSSARHTTATGLAAWSPAAARRCSTAT